MTEQAGVRYGDPSYSRRLGAFVPVLEGGGFVQLYDSMGHDFTPVEAARVSFGGSAYASQERNERLLRYLATNQHLGPFEMIETVWVVQAPRFVARQWMRHRTGSYNEFSQRYADPTVLSDAVEDENGRPLYYSPSVWRKTPPKGGNKQGSGAESFEDVENDALRFMQQTTFDVAVKTYKEMLRRGVSNELARIVLPESVYTRFWYKTNLRNLVHFLELRTDEHAQYEIRAYANEMKRICAARWPLAMESLGIS